MNERLYFTRVTQLVQGLIYPEALHQRHFTIITLVKHSRKTLKHNSIVQEEIKVAGFWNPPHYIYINTYNLGAEADLDQNDFYIILNIHMYMFHSNYIPDQISFTVEPDLDKN